MPLNPYILQYPLPLHEIRSEVHRCFQTGNPFLVLSVNVGENRVMSLIGIRRSTIGLGSSIYGLVGFPWADLRSL